jgi:hypothetical protein
MGFTVTNNEDKTHRVTIGGADGKDNSEFNIKPGESLNLSVGELQRALSIEAVEDELAEETAGTDVEANGGDNTPHNNTPE